MISLQQTIRNFALQIPEMGELGNYLDTKSLFTRRPAPVGAEYPMAFISPIVGTNAEGDFLSEVVRPVLHTVNVYGWNDTPENYRTVESIAFGITGAFNRPERHLFTPPEGWEIVDVSSWGPLPAPTDDDKLVGRSVTLRFVVKQG